MYSRDFYVSGSISADFTYKDNAELYNKVEDIPGEREMLIQGSKHLLDYAKRVGRKISILDVCCGTELILDFLSSDFKNRLESFVGVDISQKYLDDAKKRIGSDPRFELVNHDAVLFRHPRKFDVIIASSAYHHIEDERKPDFLNNIFNHLKDDGIVVFMENIIPKYSNRVERDSAAIEFYAKRIVDCIDNHEIKDERISLLSRVMQYERDREYEWKSHYSLFTKHLAAADLEVISVKKVWPKEKIFSDNNVGDFVFLVKKK
ncbi:MAG: class I SAM-dependent methyltransferase [Candidatus Diapherotrites archaeon]|uniref:Class I SAM-dependent methyltransferase n=1 Tax=Candidatus Iainarchaeum sp. TaxID=3101447 RepID=A0A7J4IVX0_9ARCH|nr:MAG: tRNA (cmo5U34)-methyltransferase [archaeon GW2011_AR10]MBS3059386.1 class I SAM-dependent methyltransferase [Candidatus Diapherotrites archaeon]HIH08499.1 class I SAM-dependent methyltransferase [Candidatus Diapherotrites archaeon]